MRVSSMRVSSIAISTLAALAAGELSHQAIAARPDIQADTPKLSVDNYVVPTDVAVTPAPSTAVASPEVVVMPEFAPAQSSSLVAKSAVEPIAVTATPTNAPLIAQSTQKPANSGRTSNVVIPTTPVPRVRTPVPTTNPVVQSPGIPSITNDLAVTALDVQIVGATQELQQVIRNTIQTRPGGQTSSNQLQNDVSAILNTGFFADARVNTTNQQTGVNVVFEVQPVVLRSLQLSGNKVLTPAVANSIFQAQLGSPVSPNGIRQGIQQLTQWYTDNGYVLAQVVDAQPTSNGVLQLAVAEGVVGKINVRFLDKEGDATNGRTRENFVRQELQLKPGEAFRLDVARADLQQLYRSGLFDNVNIALDGDARKVDVTYDLTERPARAVNVGGGYSDNSGIFGTISYKDQNFGGINQRLGLDVQASPRDLQFEGNFTDPYRASQPERPGYNVNAFRRRSTSSTFDGDVTLEGGDQPREGQFGGGISLQRPIDGWDTTVGLNYTRTSIRDGEGNIRAVDEQGNQLSFSGTGIDDLVTVSAGVTRDQRNNIVNPTSGSILKFSTEQSVPIGSGNILMNRLQGSYTQYAPVDLVGGKDQEVLALNVQGGTTIGDLAPYRTFNLGGLNSVRGYGTGDVGSGRSYVLASAEYRLPLFNPVGAVLFADFASDLGSGDTVPGEPGVVRDKPGVGFGYGAGLRVNSPIGVLRADYGFNDQGESRLQFGLGQRF
jgi:outer membrane protein insertion porin family